MDKSEINLYENTRRYLQDFYQSKYGKICCFFSKQLRKDKKILIEEYSKPQVNNMTYYHKLLFDIMKSKCNRNIEWLREQYTDKKLSIKNIFKRKVIGKSKRKYYLSIVCCIKNEASYIEEWIDFHINQGVEHFYIFDNESTDNIRQVLQPYIQKEIVTLVVFPGKIAQLSAYRYAIKKFGKYSKWIAIIDLDEFLFCTKEKLQDFLHEFEKYPAVGVNWVVYGPCGHTNRPKGLVTENYLLTFSDRNNPLNLRIKSIVQPSQVDLIPSNHYCWYKGGKNAVDENKHEIDGTVMYIPGRAHAFTLENSINRVRVNHYWTKSLEELRKKSERGYADGNQPADYEKCLMRLDYPLCEDRIILEHIRGCRHNSGPLCH